MAALIKACLLGLLLGVVASAAAGGEADALMSGIDEWEALEAEHGRELQQAGIKPCRWNTNFGSCDFNYDYVLNVVKPKTTGAKVAQAWFRNAKVCDSAPYQASQARCAGDNAHFCKWVGGNSPPRCAAVLQEYYNYLLACPGTIAKMHFLCKNKFTAANCQRTTGCRWVAASGRCTAARLLAQPTLLNYINSPSLATFRRAWGVCPGSNLAFNQTLCSKQTSAAGCARAKVCTWSTAFGPVCYTSDKWSPLFLYQNDPGFKFLLARCNKPTKATCEGATTAALVANSAGK